MRIFSFARRGIDLEPVEIEITLVPGMPAFQLIGLPDAAIRESLPRIKSALRHQEFELPKREQVLINLKPSFEKKVSQGLDLAIAVAYLIATEQISVENLGDELYLYGELSLTGEVLVPADIELLDMRAPGPLITGVRGEGLHIPHGELARLRDWPNIQWREPIFTPPPVRPFARDFSNYRITKPIADLLAVGAVGEHSLFIAGPAGTGKTTFCEMLHALLRAPSSEEWAQIEKLNRLFKSEACGRPFISPHHSATEIALLGGGAPPRPGDITRSHLGMLVLDEYLEFDPRVKESLREPMERREITVSRVNGRVTFPADFLLVATSNLCPCGEYTPNGKEAAGCSRSATYCTSYYRKLSGPLLDRFDVIGFSDKWKTGETVAWVKIKETVEKARAFALETRGQKTLNSRLSPMEVEVVLPPFVRENLMPELPMSHRRRLALLRVARTLADLEGSVEVAGRHVEGAKAITLQPFQDIKKAWF